MSCGFYNNFDWVTREITIDWLFGHVDFDGVHRPAGPWWDCINCGELFYSTTLCCEPCCNPFSGYCRAC